MLHALNTSPICEKNSLQAFGVEILPSDLPSTVPISVAYAYLYSHSVLTFSWIICAMRTLRIFRHRTLNEIKCELK